MEKLNILEQLYLGKIRPLEEIGTKNTDLIEIRKTLSKMTKDLKNSLDKTFHKEIIEKLQKIEEVQGYFDTLYNYECFSYGFKLGFDLSKN